MASLEGKIPLNYIYNELKFNSSSLPYDEDEDEGSSNTLIVVLSIIGVIVLIIIIVLAIILVKKAKMRKTADESLVKDAEPFNVDNQ